jgi:hypothetical protein
VNRADLHDDRSGTKKITFHDLRATGITGEALANTELLAIMQRAGYRESKTTFATSGGPKPSASDAGEPFLPLPLDLIEATDNGHNRATLALGLSTLPLKPAIQRGDWGDTLRPQGDSNSSEPRGFPGDSARSCCLARVTRTALG